jgi:L-cysteate sulfo-lyase
VTLNSRNETLQRLCPGASPSRVAIAHLPTPLHQLPQSLVGSRGPRVLIKRDDCTGLALGGNKTRKLEFLLADALDQGCDSVLTLGAVQSNHVRQTVAAAAVFGLQAHALLLPMAAHSERAYSRSGNPFLTRLLGAVVHQGNGHEPADEQLERLRWQLESQGGRPYVIPMGGSNILGSMGYVAAAQEIVEQANAADIAIDHIVHASSSGGTQAGLTAGFAYRDSTVQVHGVNVYRRDFEAMERDIQKLSNAVSQAIGGPHHVPISLHHDALGASYGATTPAALDTISRTAREAGILLDPVYSGKAFGWLLDSIVHGRFTANQTVVFVHTGGAPALFGYEEALTPA